MKIIDGSRGEGGGQVFRTSLTLSMCTGIPVKIKNIRAGRKKPGLLRQHLSCLRASQKISGASVEGDELGARSVTFKPGEVSAGKYEFSIGSAGSSTLVFQTVYMPLLFSQGVSELVLSGGTHNGMAPSYDFIRLCFLPALNAMGVEAKCELIKYGFYPAGGGQWKITLHPLKELMAFNSMERGSKLAQSAVALSAKLPKHVVQRELNYLVTEAAWERQQLSQVYVDSHGPGNILSLRMFYDNITEVIDIVGEKGVSAEAVAEAGLTKLRSYLSSPAAVGEYLADQLLLPMALGKGGCFTTGEPSLHLKTNIALINDFIDAGIQLDQLSEGLWQVSVPPMEGYSGNSE